MKTLKQLLEEENYSEDTLAPDDITHWNEIQLIESIVREWLEQKRQDISDDTKMSIPNQLGSLRMLDELLEELK